MKKSTKAKFEKMQIKWNASEKYVRILSTSFSLFISNTTACIQENEAEELTMKLDLLKKEEKERGKKIKNLEADIVKVKAEIDNPVKLEKVEVLIEEAVRSIV
jgi:hypothetical protein